MEKSLSYAGQAQGTPMTSMLDVGKTLARPGKSRHQLKNYST